MILQPYSQGNDYTDLDKTTANSLWHSYSLITGEIKYLDKVFMKNNYSQDFIRRNTHKNSEPNFTNTKSTPVATATMPYIKLLHQIKLSPWSYNPTTSVLLTNLSLLTKDLLTTPTKQTNNRQTELFNKQQTNGDLTDKRRIETH